MSQFPESAFSLPRSVTDTETGEPVLAAPSFSGSLVSVGCGSEEWASVRRILSFINEFNDSMNNLFKET